MPDPASRFPRLPSLVAACLLSLAVPHARAQGQDGCTCADDFEVLVEKAEASYAAIPIEVRGERGREYEAVTRRVRDLAAAARTTEECVLALREWTDWFQDPHLFVGQFPDYDDEALARFRGAAERRDLSSSEARALLEERAGRLDPIEGLWFDESAEMAVVRESTAGADGRFVAVVVDSRSSDWRPGDVRAWFDAIGDGGYRAVLHVADRSPRFLDGRLYKDGLLLRIAPWAWGRRHPLTPHQDGLLHDTDPRAPTLTVRDGAVVLSIPSHDPGRRAAIEELLAGHDDALRGADTIVLDLRGNEGGSSGTTRSLEPYYWSPEPESSAPDEVPVVLASPDNRRAFERWLEWYDEPPQWLTTLLRDLEERTGELVPFGADSPPPSPPDVVHDRPRRFAVLTDAGTVSAAEAFILRARRHRRVVVYGQNTGGSIDYQNVQIVGLACPVDGLALGYPVIASSSRLPEGGFNREGIPPDVRIDPGIEDPIGWILGHEAAVRSEDDGR